MNGKQLKNSILQWAIQGKLVPQDPNDEPASVLLERIRAEKERLIKEKKIKRSKNESIIYRGEDNSYYEKFEDGTVKCIDEEIPFQIPASWEWARLKDICSMQAGKNISASKIYSEMSNSNPYRCVGGNGLRGFTSIYNTSGHYPIIGRQGALCGCLNIENGNFYATEHAVIVDSFNIISPMFMFYFLTALNLNQYATATAQPGLAVSKIIDILCPLPPLAEHNRIVNTIEDIIPLINSYEKAQYSLSQLNTTLKTSIRKSILQEAIQGKLAPQDPNDEPASVLLERIRAEKERLIKEKKIKRDKNESVIYKGDDNSYYEIVNGKTLCINDEIPFDIPESWTWVRGKSVFLPMESTHPEGEQFCYVDVDAVDNKQNTITRPKHLQSNQAPSRATRKLHKSDILFSLVRPYLRNIALVDATHSKSIASTGFYVITPNESLYPQYVFYLMLSSYVIDGLNQFMKGDNSPSINNAHIENWLYPLPPLVEQRRIVDRIKELSAHFK